ncbi:MAG: LURP-one-related family protein [Acholeplasmataceae bacterium]|nr:LURP-one-related family protein [Acholeplasmataceae bacterium]
MKQKVFSIKDRYKIFDEEQNVIFHCEGKLFSLSRKMKFIENSTDTILFHFRKKILSLFATYFLYDNEEKQIAVVKRKFSFTPKVEIESDFGVFTIEGNFYGHNFSILENGDEVANITKKWISWGDSYEMAIHDDSKTAFLLALIILIDRIFHENKNKHSY